MRPSPSARALEAIFRDLIDMRDGANYFAERVWGIDLRYNLGGDHPLIGSSAPDFALADGTTLSDHLRNGKGVLLDFAKVSLFPDQLRFFAPRITYITSKAEDPLGLAAVLVRPDGVVAWAGNAVTDFQAITQATSQWFGGA
ncbi:hypothetical protein PR016_19060 (plasmid) [Rhizobium tumorigenes]|nr:hypothetical protein [Rhizobium tumorigenes]WFS03401.1 hypothetical protein PR016_19060 [Rhizobium tumorigenes]